MSTPAEKPEWLGEALGEGDALPDLGFTARVMGALPAHAPAAPQARRSKRAPSWSYALPPAFAAAGCAVCWGLGASGGALRIGPWTPAVALLLIVWVGAQSLAND